MQVVNAKTTLWIHQCIYMHMCSYKASQSMKTSIQEALFLRVNTDCSPVKIGFLSTPSFTLSVV